MTHVLAHMIHSQLLYHGWVSGMAIPVCIRPLRGVFSFCNDAIGGVYGSN